MCICAVLTALATGCPQNPIGASGDGAALSTCVEIERVRTAKWAQCPLGGPSVRSDVWIAYQCQLIADDVHAGGVRFDPNVVAACVARIMGASCRDLDGTHVSDSCAGVFVGTISGGGACARNDVCASGLCRMPSDPMTHLPACMGTCEARVPVGGVCRAGSGATNCAVGVSCVGGTCSIGAAGTLPTGAACDTNDECVPGDHCDAVRGSTCQPFLADGSSCMQSPQCASQSCQSGVCAAGLPDGADCGLNSGQWLCASGVCGPNQTCAATSIVDVGQPCGFSSDGKAVSFCRAWCTGMGTKPGTCVALAAYGATCTDGTSKFSAAPSPCLPPAVCMNGACKTLACGL